MTRPPEVIAASGEVKECAVVAYANPVIMLPDEDGEGGEWSARIQSHRDSVFSMPLYAAPKTALQHFADEVEASGEPEKHAGKRDPLREAAIIAIGALERIHHATVSDRTDAADALRDALAFTAISSKYRQLYEQSQELLAECRSHLPLAAASWNDDEDRTVANFHVNRILDLIKRLDAALAKVQS